MAFKDITGNDRVKTILRKSLQQGRLPNSILFFGPDGVGKAQAALVLAKALNCLDLKDDACEKCRNCLAVNAGNFPDVFSEIRVVWDKLPKKEKKTDAISIDNIKGLKELAYLKPMVGKKRVFIIGQADKMTEEAANSLLKVLEEPPPDAHIILTSTNINLILPTVLSRCQVLTFSPVSQEDIQKRLVEKGFDGDKAKILSCFVRGNLRQALNLEWDEVQDKRMKTWELFCSLIDKKGADSLFREFSSARKGAREELEETLKILSSFIRDIILLQSGGESRLLMNPDFKNKLEGLTERISGEQALKMLGILESSFYALGKMGNLQLLVSMLISNFMEEKNE
jgi:DNA polymerase III delta' subunit